MPVLAPSAPDGLPAIAATNPDAKLLGLCAKMRETQATRKSTAKPRCSTNACRREALRSASVEALPLFSFKPVGGSDPPAPQARQWPLWQACRAALGKRRCRLGFP